MRDKGNLFFALQPFVASLSFVKFYNPAEACLKKMIHLE